DQAQNFVGLSFYKKAHRELNFRVYDEIAPTSIVIDFHRVAVDIGAEPAFIKEVQRLGWGICVVRGVLVGCKWGEEIGKQRDKVDHQCDDAAQHRQMVFAEFPPDESPLAGTDIGLVG